MRAVAALLFAVFVAFLPQKSSAACSNTIFRGDSYSLCEVGLDDGLRLWHSDSRGVLLGSFARLNKTLKANGKQLGFAMNAGMFGRDRRPVGLYIEDGRQITPLADGGSYGNFGLKPNGVFCITASAFRVIETHAFRAAPPACQYATQSGPMLVIDGALHPRFRVTASSHFIRNGVGASTDGTRAVFVISNVPVTFHQFASFFRDGLGLPNALYLDGNVSQLYAPKLGRDDIGATMGPIIGTSIPAQ